MKHNNAITGFRGVVIFLVIFRHFSSRYGELFEGTMSISFPFYSLNGGTIGNVVFMTMAGFFMYRPLILGKGGGAEFIKYIINRYWRFWPTYALSVLCCSVILNCFPIPGWSCDLVTTIVNFFFIIHPGFPSVERAHWFIIALLEIQVFLALLLLIKDGYKRNYFLYGFVLITLGAVLGGWVSLKFFPSRIIFYFYCVLCGVLLAKLYETKFLWPFLFCMISVFQLTMDNFRASICAGIFLFLFVLIVKYPRWFWMFEKEPFYIIGKVSFTWYLVHQFIGYDIMYYLLPKGEISMCWILVPLMTTFTLAYLIDLSVSRLPHRIIN